MSISFICKYGFHFKKAGGRGARALLSRLGRRLRDESDFPLLQLCALWEVMSIQYVQAPHPYGSTMMGVGGLYSDLSGHQQKARWIAALRQDIAKRPVHLN